MDMQNLNECFQTRQNESAFSFTTNTSSREPFMFYEHAQMLHDTETLTRNIHRRKDTLEADEVLEASLTELYGLQHQQDLPTLGKTDSLISCAEGNFASCNLLIHEQMKH